MYPGRHGEETYRIGRGRGRRRSKLSRSNATNPLKHISSRMRISPRDGRKFSFWLAAKVTVVVWKDTRSNVSFYHSQVDDITSSRYAYILGEKVAVFETSFVQLGHSCYMYS